MRTPIALAVAVVAFAIGAGAPGVTASPSPVKASPLTLLLTTSGADGDLGVELRVSAGLPGVECGGRASQRRLSAYLPNLRTNTNDGAAWAWDAGSGTPRARINVQVTCAFPNAYYPTGRTAMVVGPGPPISAGKRVSLIRPGSLHEVAWSPGKTSIGVGGGAPGESLYPVGECTWYAHLRRPDLPYFPGVSGNAKNWITAARKYGFPTGSTPEKGAVAVFQPGQYGAGFYGHVAYVVSVDGSVMTIAEADFDGRPPGSLRTIPWAGLEFVYHKRAIGPRSHPTPPVVFPETAGGITATWSDYREAGGTAGPRIPAGRTVTVSCRLRGFRVADGNPWWYRIASPPWGDMYYASADGFYNDGHTTGTLSGTPYVDPAVPLC